jgi:hypothetical protein
VYYAEVSGVSGVAPLAYRDGSKPRVVGGVHAALHDVWKRVTDVKTTEHQKRRDPAKGKTPGHGSGGKTGVFYAKRANGQLPLATPAYSGGG